MSSSSGPWLTVSNKDPRAAALADRHYNRQHHGSRQFMPPARSVVLLTPDADAVWGWSWPYPEYVRHAWPGAWVCSTFRNESGYRSSYLVEQAPWPAVAKWGAPPTVGVVTFVDRSKVRHKRDPGRCFLRAGWRVLGYTKRGLVVLGWP